MTDANHPRVELHEHDLQHVLRGDRPWCAHPAHEEPPAALLPGSFNPLHHGHQAMLQLGAEYTSGVAAYELSAANVDKASLGVVEVRRRLAQFTAARVYVTAAPTFSDKAELFPGATFLVGADTIARVGDPAYYRGEPKRMHQAIERIAARGNRFLVFARVMEGSVATVDTLALPRALRDLCTQAPVERFRLDISSTQLRERER